METDLSPLSGGSRCLGSSSNSSNSTHGMGGGVLILGRGLSREASASSVTQSTLVRLMWETIQNSWSVISRVLTEDSLTWFSSLSFFSSN